MENLRFRYVFVMAIFLLTAITVKHIGYVAFHKSSAGTDNIKKIPYRIGAWTGYDVALEEQVYRILETRAIIHRSYRSEVGHVFLSVVHYPDTKVDFHAPEGCLMGKGVKIEKSVRNIIVRVKGQKKVVKLNQLIRKNNDTKELIYYWYKTGDFIGESYFDLRLSLVLNRVLSSRRSGSLIRVSTIVRDLNIESESVVLSEFIQNFYPYMDRIL